MYVSIEKLLTKKIYYDSDLVLRTNVNNKINVVLSDGITFDNFEKTFEQLFFLPNSPINLYYPKKYINMVSGQEVSKVQEKNDFFKEVNSRKLKSHFHKIEELKEIDFKDKNHKPVLVNLSKFQSDISDYLSKHKKNFKDSFTIINKFFKIYLDKDVPAGNRNIFFIINQSTDIFVKYFDYGLKKEFKELKALFANSNVFIINPFNKLTLKLDVQNEKVNINTANLLYKFVQLSVKFDKDKLASNSDLEVLKSDLSITELDTLPEIIQPEHETATKDDKVTEKQVDTIHDLKVKKDLDENSDMMSVNSVDIVSDVDFDELTDKGVITEFDKVKKDNEEFLARMMPYQEKALKEYEAKAALLSSDKTLDTINVKDSTIINKNMKHSSINSISISYYKKQYLKDMLEIFKSLNNDPDNPVVITKFEIENKNDSLNLQDEVSAQFLDKKGKRHSFTVDIPKMSHDGYLYYNGSKKFITKQSTLLPVIKESNERVQVTTNYKKSFLYRKGDKVNVTVDKALRLIMNKDYKQIKKVYGNSSVSNVEYNVSIAYNYLANKFFSIEIGKVKLVLNQKQFKDYFEKNSISFNITEYSPIAFDGLGGLVVEDCKTRKIYSYNTKTNKVGNLISESFTEYVNSLIVSIPSEDIIKDYRELSNSKSLAYSEIRIAGTSLSIGALIAFYKGFLGSLDTASIKYTMEDKRRRVMVNETVFPFKDSYIYVNSQGNASKELFINGLSYLNTKEYNLSDSERLGIMYLEYFNDYTGSRNTAKALTNFENSMIDPITLEVLKDLKLPEKFPELIVYANEMLGDYNHKRKNDTTNFRMRGSEVINVALYSVLINAFNNYKRTAKTGMVSSISPNSKDAVKKAMSENPNVEGYSTLNPYFEIEMIGKTSYKGPSGLV